MNKWLWAAIVIIILVIGVWLLSAKTAGAPTTQATTTAGGIPQDTFGTYPYECDEHVTFTMTPSSDMSTITLAPTGSGTYPPATTLTRVATSSGVLFRGGGLTFFGRGESVSLTEGEQSLNCSPVPDQNNAPFNFGD